MRNVIITVFYLSLVGLVMTGTEIGKADDTKEFKINLICRDKQETLLSDVEVTLEFIRESDWTYSDLGSGQKRWPVPAVQDVGPVVGKTTGMSGIDGRISISWRGSDTAYGVFVTLRKDGYTKVYRSPMNGLIRQGETSLDMVTMAMFEDMVHLRGRAIDKDSGHIIKDAVLTDLGFWHFWRRRNIIPINENGEFDFSIDVRNQTLNDRPKNLAIQARDYPIQKVTFEDSQGNKIDMENTSLAGMIIEGLTVRVEKGHVIKGRLLSGDGLPVAMGNIKHEPVRWNYVIYETDKDGMVDIGPLLLNEERTQPKSTYVDITWPGFTHAIQENPEKININDIWEIRLPTTRNIRGHIVNEEGEPFKSASLDVGSEMANWITAPPRELSDGWFEIDAPMERISTGTGVLNVSVDGYAPQAIVFSWEKAKDESLEIIMKRGKPVGGRVIDEKGKPIVKVWVVSENVGPSRQLKIGASTGENGEFHWEHFSEDQTADFSILKEGYLSVRKYRFTPGKTDHVIVLQPPIVIHGKVIDVNTGVAINQFELIQGNDFTNDGRISWNRWTKKTFNSPDGSFEMTFSEPFQGKALLQVQAHGYLPGNSTGFTMTEHPDEVLIKLGRGENLTGAILTPTGNPADKAELAIATSEKGVYIQGIKMEQHQEAEKIETDNYGCFTFTPRERKGILVVVHNSGYFQQDFAKVDLSKPVTLSAWSRVEGALMIGKQVGVNQEMVISPENEYDPNGPRITWRLQSSTDKQGHFVFEYVPAGKIRVCHYIRRGNMGMFSHPVDIDLQPGSNVTVQIGGGGRKVIGKMNATEGMTVYWNYVQASLRPDIPRPEIPEELEDKTDGERKAWFENWKKSPEGQSYEASHRKLYAVIIEPDGSFQVDDIPSGNYILWVGANEPPADGLYGFGKQVANVTLKFNVPVGEDDKPLEVGPLVLERLPQPLQVGQDAPLFEVKTLDGEFLKLSDLIGKFVLIDFWATWCGPYHGEVPHLKSVWEKYRKNSKFAMIGLSLDKNVSTVQKYIQKEQIGWIQGFLGDLGEDKVTKLYGVQGIPSAFLIGPDRKVVASGLRGEAILQAVEKVLK